MSKHLVKSLLESKGIDFTQDFHILPSAQVELLVEQAKLCKYRKPDNANGSTAREFFYYLARTK
jgi:hypothetical protein